MDENVIYIHTLHTAKMYNTYLTYISKEEGKRKRNEQSKSADSSAYFLNSLSEI